MFFLTIHIPFLKKLEIRYVSFPWTDIPTTSHNVPRKFQKVGEKAMMGHHGRGCGKRCGRQGWEGKIRPFLDFGLPGSHNISLFCCAPCSASVPAVSVLNFCGPSRSHSQGEGESLDAARLTAGSDNAEVSLQLPPVYHLPRKFPV